MILLMLLVATTGTRPVPPLKPVVTAADRAAMRAACTRFGSKIADPAVRKVQIGRCLAQIPPLGAPLVTTPAVVLPPPQRR